MQLSCACRDEIKEKHAASKAILERLIESPFVFEKRKGIGII